VHLVRATRLRSWELYAPLRTFDLHGDDGEDEERDDGGLAAECDSRTRMLSPVELEVCDGEST
jgi:hypothetical protein